MSALNTEVVTPEAATELLRKMREIATTSADDHQCWARMVGAVMGAAGYSVAAVVDCQAAFFPRKAA